MFQKIYNLLKQVSANPFVDGLLKFKELIALLVFVFWGLVSGLANKPMVIYSVVDNAMPVSVSNQIDEIVHASNRPTGSIELFKSRPERLDITIRATKQDKLDKFDLKIYGVFTPGIFRINPMENEVTMSCVESKGSCEIKNIEFSGKKKELKIHLWGSFYNPDVVVINGTEIVSGSNTESFIGQNRLQIYFIERAFWIVSLLVSISLILGLRRVK